MADLPRPLTTTTCSTPAFTASSTTSWMVGVSTMGSISLGMALVAGRKRVPRPAAMGGANAAIATGNDALSVNPPGLTQGHRYHLELDGLYDSRYPAQAVLASLVDSVSSPVATGLMWSRWASGQPSGRGEGWSVGFGYSGAVGQNLFLGGETKFLRFHTPDGLVQKWAQDFGLLARRGNFSWAAVLQNVSLEKIPLFPLAATAAMAWGTDTDWHLSVDYRADLSDSSNVKSKAALGGEL